MRGFELFKAMSPATAGALINWFREEERDVYRGVLQQLAQLRRLRPVFITRKSSAEQVAWMHKTLSIRSAADLADQLLQIWLLKGRTDMLKGFLEDLGIEHEDDGSVEDLPETLDAEKLGTAVDSLLENHPTWEATCLLYTSPSPRDLSTSRMPSSA